MSVNPVLAALVGLLILGQSLEWLAIATIVSANTVSVLTADRSRARLRRRPGSMSARVAVHHQIERPLTGWIRHLT